MQKCTHKVHSYLRSDFNNHIHFKKWMHKDILPQNALNAQGLQMASCSYIPSLSCGICPYIFFLTVNFLTRINVCMLIKMQTFPSVHLLR